MPPKTPNPNATEHERKERKKFNFFSENWGITAQNKFELKVKKIRSDNGSEFKNLQVEEYLEEEGIKHEFSAPYTPQQNGVVERKNRTLIDMARTMLGEFKTFERF
jgi:transposase InsO family protein